MISAPPPAAAAFFAAAAAKVCYNQFLLFRNARNTR